MTPSMPRQRPTAGPYFHRRLIRWEVSAGVVQILSLETGMLPGGYDFIHIVFWLILGLIAVGTNLIPIVLSAGIGILLFETIKGK